MDSNRIKEFVKVAADLEILNQQAPSSRPHRDPVTEVSKWEASVADNINQSKNTGQTYVVNVFNYSHNCKLSLDQLTPICLNEMQVPKVHTKRYLICKVVGTPYATASVNALVQDLNGDLEELNIYNYSYNIADTKWIPVGTVLIIKEPYLHYGSTEKNVLLYVDSPSDFILVDPTDLDFLKKVGAEKWHLETTMDPEKIKEEGNQLFKAKDYEAATFLYNRAIRIAPNMAVLYLNKASSQLRSGYFDGAYESAKTALDKGGDREKALFRMGLAAYGLRDWKLALDHFQTVCKEFPDNKDVEVELDKTKQRLAESQTGNYDWKEMRSAVSDGKRELDVADYTGPIEIADIPGKGKGIVAKEDIPKGTLLAVSKPFSIAYQKDLHISLVSVNVATYDVNTGAGKLQMIRSIEQVRKNPSKSKELYKLYAGDLPRDEDIPDGVIDSARIEQITVLNSFNINGNDIENFVGPRVTRTCGLYLLPSYLNHDCMPTAKRTFIGDVMLVRATKDLKKGEEINFAYTSPLNSYSERTEILAHRGFKCKCRLCKMDSEDPNCSERAELLKHVVELNLCYNPSKFVVAGKELLERMRRLYHNRTELKIDLAQMLDILARTYFNVGEIKVAIKHYEEMISLVNDEFVTSLELPTTLLHLARCYDLIGEEKKTAEWLQKAYDMSFCTDLEHFTLIYTDVPDKYLKFISETGRNDTTVKGILISSTMITPNSRKRKRQTITLAEKQEIIEASETKPKVSDLVTHFNNKYKYRTIDNTVKSKDKN